MFCTYCGARSADDSQFCSNCGRPLAQTAAMPPVPGAPQGVPSPAPVRYAGFWLRFVANLIDGFVLAPLVLIVVFVILGVGVGVGAGMSRSGRSAEFAPFFVLGFLLLYALLIAGIWLYHALMESSSWQATLGKKALDLQVVDLAGRRISFGRATGRHFAKILSGLTLNIGYIMAGFTEKKQALHDMVAGTLVIRR